MDVLKYETHKGKQINIANSWEQLTRKQFINLTQLLALYSLNTITANDVKLHFVAHYLGVDLRKITDVQAMSNLMIIADRVSFIFNEQGKLSPFFLKQMLPKLYVGNKRYDAYTINTSFDILTCSLTALQFIEAQELLKGKGDKLPLLASILYCKPPYSSDRAHTLANKFLSLPNHTLLAIALNFQAFVGYLFHKTHFSILIQGHEKPKSEITIGMADMLYNLSSDGLGNVENIEQMGVVKYLSIMRKKLIESVRAMNESKVDLTEIVSKTGLDYKTINKILK